jgi:hypothetical protein
MLNLVRFPLLLAMCAVVVLGAMVMQGMDWLVSDGRA